MNFVQRADKQWDFADPKVGEMVFISCKSKTSAEFVGRVVRIAPDIKLAQLADITKRHFDLSPIEYSKLEEDFVRFSKTKEALVRTLTAQAHTADSFVTHFFRYSSSGGLGLAVALATEVFQLSEAAAKELSNKHASLAYTKLASYQKGFKKTASLPMYDWNILDPVWELDERNGAKVIVRRAP